MRAYNTDFSWTGIVSQIDGSMVTITLTAPTDNPNAAGDTLVVSLVFHPDLVLNQVVSGQYGALGHDVSLL